MELFHKPVLVQEVKENLPSKLENFVDATLGLGGHAKEILSSFKIKRYIGFEKDVQNLETAKANLKDFEKVCELHQAGYENMLEFAQKESTDAVFYDLGICRTQVDDSERGFSFRKEGPLDMRFDKNNPLTAELIVNTWRKEDLERIIREYGEEKVAGRVASAIVKKRPFYSTTELAEVIEKVLPRSGKIHGATRTFQALRICVNSELENVQKGLTQGLQVLRRGGRMLVISYHSLEDRIVKNFFRTESKDCICSGDLPICQCNHKAQIKIINKKVIIPLEQEIKLNPAARSAKLRIAEKI